MIKRYLSITCCLLAVISAKAQQYDPPCAVEKWSDSSTYDKIISIDFSDEDMPDTWRGTTGKDCPSFADGGYSNGILDIPVLSNGVKTDVTYPLLFHNCTFANKDSYNGFAAATAAFSRIYYHGENATGNSAARMNNWTVPGHTIYLEDNIEYNEAGKPTRGLAGYAHLCRDAAQIDAQGNKTSMHGWIEIDHIPYIERVQWSWSSSSWGRGVKCDIKVGDGDWEPLVWMGSEKQKQGYTDFSDQGYFMENVVDRSDVSLRWRIWDGDGDPSHTFQTDVDGNNIFASVPVDPYASKQSVKIHKIQIFGNSISSDDAQYARDHQVSDIGEFTFGKFESPAEEAAAQDVYRESQFLVVDPNFSRGKYKTIQSAVDAVNDGARGFIYIKNGTYAENVHVGTATDKNKFISLIGESADGVVITSSLSRGAGNEQNTYADCAALSVYVSKFYAENITIQNTSGNVGQAEALYIAGDAHMLRNCRILGYQDTFKSNVSARGYFYNCYIEGATDFIYDSGLEWFENCTINCVKADKGYITAAADASLSMSKVIYPSLSADVFHAGLFFSNCSFTASDGVKDGSYYLGRPWKENCGTAFINCTFGKHINAAGWLDWNNNGSSASYYEYNNVDTDGNPVDVKSRVTWSHQATKEEVEAYFNTAFLFSTLNKKYPFTPELLLGSISAPDVILSESDITWDEVDGAALYILYRDGVYYSSTTSRSLNIKGKEDSSWAVKAVSRRGVTSSLAVAHPALLAFPTAAGFGKLATGGRGGKVVYVTNLDDDGEGSLRWAFAQYPDEPLTIVFSVSGEIVLKSPLKVKRNDWTLAGQTAPGEGILLSHDKANFGGSQNFIVRNIRFRIGQKNAAGEIYAESACGAENCQNFIFDHCNFGWSVEENMDTQDSHFLTVQYSIVHEGLYNAGHSKGERGYGCQWGGSPATYHHNLLANNYHRSCRFNGSRGEDYVSYIEYFNNVVYNYSGGNNGCYGGENTADITEYNGKNSAHECNFVGNYYKPGPATSSEVYFVMPSYARSGAKSWAASKWYFNDNIMYGHDDINADNWKGVSMNDAGRHYTQAEMQATSMIRPELNYYKYSVSGSLGEYDYDKYAYAVDTFETADKAYYSVLSCVGTVNRDKIEQRLITEVRSGQATYGGKTIGTSRGIIDTENDCEGFYLYNQEYDVPVDTDQDGMPDAWEEEHGTDPLVADNNTVSTSGYTMLEVYLNSLFGQKAGYGSTPLRDRLQMNLKSNSAWIDSDNNIHCSVDADYCVTVYNAMGQVISVSNFSGKTFHLETLANGVSLIKITSQVTSPRVIKR